MDKIFKILRKRRKDERLMIMAAIQLIENNELKGLDILKLTGYKNLYRARVDKFRIIYQVVSSINKIIIIDERNDKTYKSL